jgi:hypothetical protein
MVTRSTFHDAMFALNAHADSNACDEPHPVDADGTRLHGSARMRGRPIAHAHTDAAHGRVCAAARIGDPFVGVARRAWIWIHACMRGVYIHCICACSIDGWRYEESASHSRTCRVLAHRQRPHAIARVCTNTHAYPFTYPDFASIHIYIYIST